MVPYHTKAAKKNLQDGITKMNDKLTRAEKIVRRFKAGAPRQSDIFTTALGAVVQGLGYLTEIRSAMSAAGLNPEDATAGVIFEVIGALGLRAVRIMGNGLEAAQSIMRLSGEPRGLLFVIVDREKGDVPLKWARHYSADKQVLGDVAQIEMTDSTS